MWLRLVEREEKVELCSRVSHRQLGLSTISDLRFVMSLCTVCGSAMHCCDSLEKQVVKDRGLVGGNSLCLTLMGEKSSAASSLSLAGGEEEAESRFCCAVALGGPDEPFGTDSMRTELLIKGKRKKVCQLSLHIVLEGSQRDKTLKNSVTALDSSFSENNFARDPVHPYKESHKVYHYH